MLVFCVFKQKTAYEMRISDWSSDVCSSDLSPSRTADPKPSPSRGGLGGDGFPVSCSEPVHAPNRSPTPPQPVRTGAARREFARSARSCRARGPPSPPCRDGSKARDRQSDVKETYAAARVALRGRRIIQ